MINLKQAKPLVKKCMRQHIVPYLMSSPGLGKSALFQQIANELNLILIDLRLANADPTDIRGYPAIIDGKATYITFEEFPTIKTKIPAGKKGWILLLDELTSCTKAIQTAAFPVIHDHKVGNTPLHPKLFVTAAGNLATDNAHVIKMSTALQSRMVHLPIQADAEIWIDWAREAKIQSRVIAYIGYKKTELHQFDPKHADHTFRAPRTWEMLSKLIEDEPVLTPDLFPLLEGTVGVAGFTGFRNFIQYFSEIVTLDQIMQNPEGVALPSPLGHKHALTSVLSDALTLGNGSTLMKCITRLPIEFQAMCLLTAMRRDPILEDVDEIHDWFNNNAQRVA